MCSRTTKPRASSAVAKVTLYVSTDTRGSVASEPAALTPHPQLHGVHPARSALRARHGKHQRISVVRVPAIARDRRHVSHGAAGLEFLPHAEEARGHLVVRRELKPRLPVW